MANEKKEAAVKRTGAIYNAEGKVVCLTHLEVLAKGGKIDAETATRYPHLSGYTAEQAKAELEAYDALVA